MNRSGTLFLKCVLCIIATGVAAALVWSPQTEGRAANLDLVSIYADPLIIYSFVSSIPFFTGMYLAFKLLNLIDADQAFSQEAVNTLKHMKLAALTLIGFIIGALIFIRFFAGGEDAAGPTMLGISLSLAFSVIATAASVFQKLLQNAIDIKSENDLTV